MPSAAISSTIRRSRPTRVSREPDGARRPAPGGRGREVAEQVDRPAPAAGRTPRRPARARPPRAPRPRRPAPPSPCAVSWSVRATTSRPARARRRRRRPVAGCRRSPWSGYAGRPGSRPSVRMRSLRCGRATGRCRAGGPQDGGRGPTVDERPEPRRRRRGRRRRGTSPPGRGCGPGSGQQVVRWPCGQQSVPADDHRAAVGRSSGRDGLHDRIEAEPVGEVAAGRVPSPGPEQPGANGVRMTVSSQTVLTETSAPGASTT